MTLRDVVTVLQRAEMVRRISLEIEGYVIELGADGRLVLLQLDELMGGVEADRRLVAKDYVVDAPDLGARRRDAPALAISTTTALLDLAEVAAVLQLPPGLDARLVACSHAGSACSTRSPTPGSDLGPRRRPVPQPAEDPAGERGRPRAGRGRRRRPRPRDQGRARAPRRVQHPRALHLRVSELTRGPARDRHRNDDDHRRRRRRGAGDPCGTGRRRRRRRRGRAPRHHGHPPAVRRSVRAPRIARLRGRLPRAVRSCDPRGARHRRRRRCAWRRARRSTTTSSSAISCAPPISSPTPTASTTVHVIGFCMGGMQTLKAAATGRFARAVAFYGMIRVPADWRGAGCASRSTPPPTCVRRSRSSAMPTRSLRRATSTRSAPRGAIAADCEIVVYPGAEHGFVHVPERPGHRPDDAADAWRRTLAWLA